MDKSDIGRNFQKLTAYERGKLGGKRLNWAMKPETYKNYASSKKIQLPQPDLEISMKFSDCINNRHSVRFFKNENLTLNQISYLLWSSTGIQRMEQGYEFRSSPSAGALYPIETYLVVKAVNALKPGIYHYNIKYHCLELVKSGKFTEDIQAALLNQRMVTEASVTILWTAIFKRSTWKYDSRGYRYVYLDAGHIAAQFSLAAVDIGLGTCQIGALYDGEVNKILDLDESSESVLYASVVGIPKKN